VSQGGAYVHNLIAGAIQSVPFDARQTPFHKAHSTDLAGMHNNPFGDDKYYNNLFVGPADLSVYDRAPLAVKMEGNVFLKGARPSRREPGPVVRPDLDPGLKLIEKDGAFELDLTLGEVLGSGTRRLVTTRVLGKAVIPGLPYEQSDGSPVRVDRDYFGKTRNEANPTPGPFEAPGAGPLRLKVGRPIS
jgi:hypothetical protein